MIGAAPVGGTCDAFYDGGMFDPIRIRTAVACVLGTLRRTVFLPGVWRVALPALCVLAPVSHALAIMAGVAPDTPEQRADAATPDSAWSGVGAVLVGDSPYSGVAIGPCHVLTAAHVVGRHPPAELHFAVTLEGPGRVRTMAVERVDVFPDAAFPYDDLALLRLEAALPDGVATYPVGDVALSLGQLIRLAGFGASGHGDAGPSVAASARVRRLGENVIDAFPLRIGPPTDEARTSRFFLYDFDGPRGRGPLGGPTLGNARESTVAGGDSGSGAFAQIGGRWVLVGINTFASRTADGARQQSIFGSVGGGLLLSDPKTIEWIDRVTEGAAHWASGRSPTPASSASPPGSPAPHCAAR